jgi:hypothetical protein
VNIYTLLEILRPTWWSYNDTLRYQMRVWRAVAILAISVAIALAFCVMCDKMDTPSQGGMQFTLLQGDLSPGFGLLVYAAEVDPVWERKVEAAAKRIAKMNPHVDARQKAELYVRASFEAQLPEPANFWLLVAIGECEATHYTCLDPDRAHYPDSVGTIGERGLLQISPAHFDNMRTAGLDPTDEYDLVLWGAVIIAGNLQRGNSVRRAVRIWATADEAVSLFWKLKGGN